MATKTDQQPLLDQDSQELPPPPAYKPVESRAVPPQGYSMNSSMKLPTYDQSEKYSSGDVVVVTAVPVDEEGSGDEQEARRRESPLLYRSGTLLEFILFFFICVFLGFFGIILAFCFATSVAAQSGAIAGLGATFVVQPLVYEFYYKNYEHDLSTNWCATYTSGSDAQLLQSCMHRTTIGIRLVLLTFGLIGLVLLYKGFSTYFRSIRSSNQRN